MAPFYEEVCSILGWSVDTQLLSAMKAANEVKLKEIDDSIADAEKNQGEMEVRDFMLKKAEYYSSIGAKVGRLHFNVPSSEVV
jgi:26S proteasome regulatory subunit N7